MKPQTLSLAKVVKQALLEFPPSDLLELIDYWISKLDTTFIPLETINKIRCQLGYQLLDRDLKNFIAPNPKTFYQIIKEMSEEEFYHQIIGLAGQVVKGCGEPPDDFNEGYEFMSILATKLYQLTASSSSPATIGKVMLNYE